jgi:isopentenyl-diphosphate delta-isomerase
MSSERKDEHVRLAEELHDESRRGGFDDVRFLHRSFPGLAVADVSTGTRLAGRDWTAPFYINAMTGGSERTGRLNAQLARAAAEAGVAIASGSVSAALREPALEPTFRVIREQAPEAFVLANVSPEATPEQARHAVALLSADALQIHVNVAQELVMPEGDRDFTGWLDRIAAIVAASDVPVVVKEVGFGLGREAVTALVEHGVTAVDVSGRGGTDFIAIENHRRLRSEYGYLTGWGQTAVECLLDVLHRAPEHGGPVEGVTVLASGGVRTPLDVLRALALGARAVGVSGHFLHVLVSSGLEALIAELVSWRQQLRTLFALVGARDLAALQEADLLVTGPTGEFARLRGIDLAALATRRERAARTARTAQTGRTGAA